MNIFINIFLDNWVLPEIKYGHCGFQCPYLLFFIFCELLFLIFSLNRTGK